MRIVITVDNYVFSVDTHQVMNARLHIGHIVKRAIVTRRLNVN